MLANMVHLAIGNQSYLCEVCSSGMSCLHSKNLPQNGAAFPWRNLLAPTTFASALLDDIQHPMSTSENKMDSQSS